MLTLRPRAGGRNRGIHGVGRLAAIEWPGIAPCADAVPKLRIVAASPAA